jgi:glycosyltransferase involved in cell wall biosynthesis
MYNVIDHDDLGAMLPTMYYSYGALDPGVKPDVWVASSDYARKHRSYGPENDTVIEEGYVVPPMLSCRIFRRIKSIRRPKILTIGILTSGYHDKYPCEQVIQLLSKIPEDIALLMTTLPKFQHYGMELAVADRSARTRGRFWPIPLIPMAGIQYLLKCDVLLYATAPGHGEPGGRLVLEAMTMGKTVIVENQGVFAETLEHGVNALLYDTVDEAVDHIARLKKSPEMLLTMGANAEMYASWYDSSVHLSKLKRILRMIGT